MRLLLMWLLAFAIPTFFVRWLFGFVGHWFPRSAEFAFWVFAVLWLFASLQLAVRYSPLEDRKRLGRFNRALGRLNTPW